MKPSYLRLALARDPLDCQNPQHERSKTSEKNARGTYSRKLKERIVSSLALVLKVYANENHLYDTENVLFLHGVSQAYKCLRNAFPPKNEPTELSSSSDVVQLPIGEQRSEVMYSRYNRTLLCYPSLFSKYLQDCQRMNTYSLCKSMIKITSRETRIFVNGSFGQAPALEGYREGYREDLARVTRLMVKLHKYLKQKYQSNKVSETLEVHSFKKIPRSLPTARDQRTSPSMTALRHRCDKGIQCPSDSEYLKVSSDLKFFSRSSLVINVEPTSKKPTNRHRGHRRRENASKEKVSHTMSSPSLEYVAYYRPEFRRLGQSRDAPNLRCFSSSAIFGLKADRPTSRRLGIGSPRDQYSMRARSMTSTPRSRLARRYIHFDQHERLKETMRQTESELLKYSNMIEDDLISFHRKSKFRGGEKHESRASDTEDIRAVKKILLEDYITEVKEIIRSERRQIETERESEILTSVKKRMDEDLAEAIPLNLPSRTESWYSLRACTEGCEPRSSQVSPCKSKTSYVTACDSSLNLSWCSCCCQSRNHSRGSYKKGSRDNFREQGRCTEFPRHCQAVRSLRCRNRRLEEVLRSWADSSDLERLEEKRAATSATSKSSRSVDSGVLADYPRQTDSWRSSEESSSHSAAGEKSRVEETESSGGSCNDDVLCQRVESAVRKFTEELILCERRARDRSRSRRKHREKHKTHTPLPDQSFPSHSNYLLNSRCSSEDEPIAGISTPSLVSLSDSEIPTSPRT